MNYAIVNQSGLVINVCVWDGKSTWSPPESHQAIKLPANSEAGIGWSYADGQFIPPEEPSQAPLDT